MLPEIDHVLFLPDWGRQNASMTAALPKGAQSLQVNSWAPSHRWPGVGCYVQLG